MSEYLQAYLDETDEELETLVQSLLTLEDEPHDENALNEAFRMLHSLKGSSGMMGYEGIAELAHHLENRFDQFRSGQSELDRAAMDLMLDCVDFFRDFARKLRAGEDTNENGSNLIQRLASLEHADSAAGRPADTPVESTNSGPGVITMGGGFQVRVTFRRGLQLADLKARLIIARLSNIGEIIGSEPPIDDVQSFDELPQFMVIVATDKSPDEVEKIANVDGVESIEIGGGRSKSADASPAPEDFTDEETVIEATAQSEFTPSDDTDSITNSPDTSNAEATLAMNQSDLSELDPNATDRDLDFSTSDFGSLTRVAPAAPTGDSTIMDAPVVTAEAPAVADPIPSPAGLPPNDTTVGKPDAAEAGRGRIAETVRVDIDRLDRLMNLTGELVVTNARFNQIAGQLSPALRNARGSGRIVDVIERLRVTVDTLTQETADRPQNGQTRALAELREDLAALEEQSTVWDEGRRHFAQITEAVDQLSRVSQNLQQGVLDTRMMPVGPLFGRFRRVIRDLTRDVDKTVDLVIRGEKTELDKRMIDELGDPLLHLIRNSIDHGLESAAERQAAGKPTTGTIVLEASHSGNNVFVTIRDDGAGISVEKVRKRVIERGLLDAQHAAALSDDQVIDYIWHPGFSTAEQVTDISGRGVGMDIVKARIAELNGSVEVETDRGHGTKFVLRLPLTLAIIRSLMIRFRDGFFSIPIDDVREIVSIPVDKIYSVHNRRTIDVRGEFIPLTTMEDAFTWHGEACSRGNSSGDASVQSANVVILQSRGRTLGLCVDELLGGADIVIKSLSDNFMSIPGLSGASIMGDGTVCLMLDTTAVLEMI